MNQRGVILISVLIITGAVIASALIIEDWASKNFDYAYRLQMENQAGFYFHSAIKVAETILSHDVNSYDSKKDRWFNLPPIQTSKDTIVSLEIFPLNEKIDLNNILKIDTSGNRTKYAFKKILLNNGVDANNALENITKWLTKTRGRKIVKRYLYSLKEIDFVKGLNGFSEKFDDYFTVSQGLKKININFAPKEVIDAYLPELSTCTDEIIKHRDKKPFKNISQLRELSCVDDNMYLKILPFITTRSQFFGIKINVDIENLNFHAEAVVKRVGKYVKLLKFFKGQGSYE